MKLELQTQGTLVREDVERFAGCRAELALAPLRDRIDSVEAFVDRRDDVARDEAIRCLVLVKSGTRPDVIVERVHRNLYMAIHLAFDEAGWALADSCAREQNDYLDQQIEALYGPITQTGQPPATPAIRAA